ncbi:hypothetical protein B566_EDAN008400 [Ephemera danica]|nr:hypothetical protein B566_EDAN008400 [Ephemera danica]
MHLIMKMIVSLLIFVESLEFVKGHDQGGLSLLKRCPGTYCGQHLLPDGNWSSCGACPRGYRANLSSVCVECVGSPEFYDWLYLGFMVILALVLHWFCIDSAMRARLLGQQQGDASFTREVLVLHASALGEVSIAVFTTLLVLEPRGSLEIRACPIKSLADWYTLLHNPSPQYEQTLHCTQEAVFPLYSMVFIFYSCCVVVLLLVRPWLVRLVTSPPGANSQQPWNNPHPLPRHGKATIYAALYFLPVLALIHALFAGLVYYAFPYILIVMSLISNAAHFAFKEDQSVRGLVTSTVSNLRNSVILVGHWTLHAYAIVAIMHQELREYATNLALLSLVPLPAIFYILTARFTDPNKMHNE